MITEEIYKDEREIIKVIAVLCANQATGILKNNQVIFNVKFKEIKSDQIFFSQVESNNKNYNLAYFKMTNMDAEVTLGGNIYLFSAIPMSEKSISTPSEIRSHPKRKYPRIKVSGNPLISKMYTNISMKVVDPNIQDEELSKKIHLIINTIESNLMRSENYDLAKITLFDGTEKSILVKILKKYKKPFVVFDTNNFKIKDEMVLTYEDYIKQASEEGINIKDIMAQLDKIKEFYIKNKIRSEALVPLIFEDEVIGQIRVASLSGPIAKANVLRLNNLSIKAVEDLFVKCSFELSSKEPQILIDLSVGGARVIITEETMYKYIRLLKRIYMQIVFPDETVLKTMATIVNIYDDTPEGYKVIGVKFSSNMDWKDKQKLEEFINSVLRLENKELLA